MVILKIMLFLTWDSSVQIVMLNNRHISLEIWHLKTMFQVLEQNVIPENMIESLNDWVSPDVSRNNVQLVYVQNVDEHFRKCGWYKNIAQGRVLTKIERISGRKIIEVQTFLYVGERDTLGNPAC